jgi:hypothetical protein
MGDWAMTEPGFTGRLGGAPPVDMGATGTKKKLGVAALMPTAAN